jgi:hypothetical protein
MLCICRRAWCRLREQGPVDVGEVVGSATMGTRAAEAKEERRMGRRTRMRARARARHWHGTDGVVLGEADDISEARATCRWCWRRLG